MNTMFNSLRDAWMMATGIILAPLLQAEKKKIRTYSLKRALSRNYALQTLSHLQQSAGRQAGPKLERSRYMDHWLRTHIPPMRNY